MMATLFIRFIILSSHLTLTNDIVKLLMTVEVTNANVTELLMALHVLNLKLLMACHLGYIIKMVWILFDK